MTLPKLNLAKRKIIVPNVLVFAEHCKAPRGVYNQFMAKKTTLNELGDMLTHVVKHMATKEDLAELKHDLTGKIVALHTQVNNIETDIHGMKQVQLETHIADLEEKVFGGTRR